MISNEKYDIIYKGQSKEKEKETWKSFVWRGICFGFFTILDFLIVVIILVARKVSFTFFQDASCKHWTVGIRQIRSSFNSARIDLPERNFEYTNFDTDFGSYLSSFNKKIKYAQNTVFIRNLSQRINRETSSDNAVRTEVGWINFSTLATLVWRNEITFLAVE